MLQRSSHTIPSPIHPPLPKSASSLPSYPYLTITFPFPFPAPRKLHSLEFGICKHGNFPQVKQLYLHGSFDKRISELGLQIDNNAYACRPFVSLSCDYYSMNSVQRIRSGLASQITLRLKPRGNMQICS